MQKSYFRNNGKYLFVYTNILIPVFVLFLFFFFFDLSYILLHFFSYAQVHTRVSKDLNDLFIFRDYYYFLLTISYIFLFGLFLSISPSCFTLLIAIYYSCKWADCLISAMTCAHNEPENTNKWHLCTRITPAKTTNRSLVLRKKGRNY